MRARRRGAVAPRLFSSSSLFAPLFAGAVDRWGTAPQFTADARYATYMKIDAPPGPFDWIAKIAAGSGGKFLLDARTYYIDQQYQLPARTEIHGAGSGPAGTVIKATPGCAGSGGFPSPPHSNSPLIGVENATVYDITVEAMTYQSVFWAAPTKAGARVSKGITITKVVCNGTAQGAAIAQGGARSVASKGPAERRALSLKQRWALQLL
eukprot:gene37003-3423_t